MTHYDNVDHAEHDYWSRHCPEHDTPHLDSNGTCPDISTNETRQSRK